MISLATGLPGHGKTLFTISFVKELSEKENRPVFYSGIKDLALPWIEIDPEKWMECPTGSIIVIDECQRLFRPTGSGAKVPEYISALETHRHQGLDIFLITQHPMLMNSNVRRLTERHWHIARRFGMQRATIFQFESCKDQPLSQQANAQRLDWAYPKKSYEYYKSAEVHTVKRRIPTKVYVILGMIALAGGAGYYVYDRQVNGAMVKGIAKGKGQEITTGTQTETPSYVPPPREADKKKPMTTEEYITAYQPRLEGLPHTAPIYDEVTKPEEAPMPVACLESKSKGCKCYSQQATPINMPQSMCTQIVKNGYFQSFALKSQQNNNQPVIEKPVQKRQEIAYADQPGNQVMEVNGLPPKKLSENATKKMYQ